MKRLKDQSPNLNPCFTAVTPNTSPGARDTVILSLKIEELQWTILLRKNINIVSARVPKSIISKPVINKDTTERSQNRTIPQDLWGFKTRTVSHKTFTSHSSRAYAGEEKPCQATNWTRSVNVGPNGVTEQSLLTWCLQKIYSKGSGKNCSQSQSKSKHGIERPRLHVSHICALTKDVKRSINNMSCCKAMCNNRTGQSIV